MITEDQLEQLTLTWFQDCGWEYCHGPDIAPDGDNPERVDYKQVMLPGRLLDSLRRINPGIPQPNLEEALHLAMKLHEPSLIQSNRSFHEAMTEGIPVEIEKDGEKRGDRVRLIDFENPENNRFLVVNQFTVQGTKQPRRPDLVCFINGIPVAVIELKNPAAEQADIWSAFNQLETYKNEIPDLFVYNEALVISDGIHARIGSLTSDKERFLPWRAIKNEKDKPLLEYELEKVVRGFFDSALLLDYLHFFILFEQENHGIIKKIAAYHQFHAVREVVRETVNASTKESGERKGGIVWHTQGSGKSISMVCFAGKLMQQKEMKNPTLVVVTDRNDLDGQLYQIFVGARSMFKDTPQQAENRDDLKSLLSQKTSGGIIFTTVQKFSPGPEEDVFPRLSDRTNIVVIADEAHRSQYGFGATLDRKSGKYKYGFAKHLHDALPNATFVGFTGTPIESEDKDTRAVFGDYVSIYDIQDAVEDGATVPIYYESRLAKLDVNQQEIEKIDGDIEEVFEDEENVAIKEASKSRWAALEKLVGAEPRIKEVAADIVQHFEARNAAADGKGMIVAMSREICVHLYSAIVALRPEWHSPDPAQGAIKVVMTGSAADKELLQPHIYNAATKKQLEKRFKNPKDPLKLVIVRDMWLTGFDVPSLHTMYLDKPMHGHTLMQAIARVNRVFRDKEGGLVVDYLGLADQLREAVARYTESGGGGRAKTDIEEVLPLLREEYEIVRDLFHGFDVAAVLAGPASKRPAGVAAAMDLVGGPDLRKRFLEHVADLSKLFSLAGAHEEALKLRDEVAFFQAVRAGLLKQTEGERKRSPEDLDAAIRQIVSGALVSDEVVDIFAAAGLKKPEISILSDEFLEEVRDLPYRNLAAELLQRLLKEEVKRQEKKNVVQASSFAARLEEAIRRYQSRAIETATLILELIAMARDFRESGRRGEKLDLSEEEVAFYDALGTNDSAVAVLGDATLKAIARELTVTVRRHASIDWNLRDSARANLRRHVRRVLKARGYPPDKAESAAETVLRQAAALGDQIVEEILAAPPPPPALPFRQVPQEELQPFENAVPVLELAAAAGRFSGEQEVDGLQEAAEHPERFEWAELPDYYRPRPGLFVARVVGESMNRRIPNGGWALFRANPQGTREGKAVLVQHREIQDTDLGGHFTLKRYHSEKAQGSDGAWEHRRITLSPDTTAEGYEPIVIEADGEEEVRVVAELLGVLE